jgi:hypothetical protein
MEGFKSGMMGKLVSPSLSHAIDTDLKQKAFRKVVLETLKSCIGSSSTEAVARILGNQALSEPDLLAQGLYQIFHGGTSVLLREIELACETGVE